jgi:uncharacterized protein (TIGR02246 family)
MNVRFLLTLAGLAISFALPTYAQQKDSLDPEVRQQIDAALMKFNEAYNKHDATAIAALFTQDAVQMLDWGEGGTFSGQQAIEKHYAADFVASPPELVGKLIQVYAIGDKISTISEWSSGLWKGYSTRIYVHELDEWKIRMDYAMHL